MKMELKTKRLLQVSTISLFVFFAYGCEEIGASCEEITELCEEEVQVCEDETSEYYTFNGEKYYCKSEDDSKSVDPCADAEEKVVSNCTEVYSKNVSEISDLLTEIRAQLRSKQY